MPRFTQGSSRRLSFRRIVFVDVSIEGKSVDGFREVFEDLIKLAVRQRMISEQQKRSILDVPMYLVNLVDTKDLLHSVIKDPKDENIEVLAYVSVASRAGLMDDMSQNSHRIEPEYQPSKWEMMPQYAFARGEMDAADVMASSIINYNQRVGLITKRSPSRNSAPSDVIIMTSDRKIIWPRSGSSSSLARGRKIRRHPCTCHDCFRNSDARGKYHSSKCTFDRAMYYYPYADDPYDGLPYSFG